MEEKEYPRPLSEFDMREVYRIIHNEQIPGFVLLEKERAYIEEYRAAVLKESPYVNQEITNETEAETEEVEEVEEAPKKRSYTRKKKVEVEEADKDPEEVEVTTESTEE